jgi:hypothetical protein
MLNRTTTLTSTAFATVLAGTGLMSAGYAPARAAADCLSGPNHEKSAGGHWHYRFDRQSRRKCWYLADEGHNTGQIPSAKSPRSAKKDSQQATEGIQHSNADARAELPALRYTDQPGHPSALEQPYAEPFADGPVRSAPEDPVPPRGNALSNSAPPVESQPATANTVDDALTDTAPEAPPTAAADHEAAAQLSADDTAISTFRLTLALLLMGAGLAVVMAPVVLKRSGLGPARRNNVPFHTRNTAEEPEEETLEERVSLASTRDIPLFLVRGWTAPD